MSKHKFPHIRVRGAAYDRGVQYGRGAVVLIKENISVYRAYFKFLTDWDWSQAREFASAFEPIIQAYRPKFIEEMRGIAAGAGIPFEDILVLNVRTEIRNAAIARHSSGECSAFVTLPERTADGHTLIGQNWDWFTAVADTVVILEVEMEEGPNFVTVVEAGLLAKSGMNAAGIGLTTNALHNDLDKDARPGVPYHAILRAILEAKNFSQAIAAITSHTRGSSANYLVAHKDGFAFNAETAPGDFSQVYITFLESNAFAHTNHYLNGSIDFLDLAPWYSPGSLVRHHCMERVLNTKPGLFTVRDIQEGLRNHFNYPESICTHPNPDDNEIDQFMTVASLIMDLDAKTMYLAKGNPCQSPFLENNFSQFLA